jgi:MOSC domain-containing protein YiiM
MSGTLTAIWLKRERRAPVDPVSAASVRAGSGLVDNVDQGGRRQITLLSIEAWRQAEIALERSLDPRLRRANLLLSGIELEGSDGRVLQIGNTRVLIRGETKPCNLMEKVCPGLREALSSHWRGGAYGEILTDGELRVGDSVEWLDENAVGNAGP